MVPLHIEGRLVSRSTIAVFYACALLLVLSFPARVHGDGDQAYQGDQTYQAERPAEEAPAHIALIDGSATID
jgi:hypothetical protein